MLRAVICFGGTEACCGPRRLSNARPDSSDRVGQIKECTSNQVWGITTMNAHDKLIKLMQGFDTAMLVTRTDDGQLTSRPMAVADMADNGELWFVTDRNSGKIADLILDQEVAVTMQGSSQFVSITGEAQVIDDREKIESLWHESWKVWFPDGKTDSTITLLKIMPQHGEYWDNSGFTGVKYLIKAGRAYLQGETPEPDESINESVSMGK